MGPSKKCWFWCNGPSTKAPQIPLRHQKTFHLALFLSNLAILKKCCTFSGLELAPKSRKKLIGALSCMHKGPKCIQSLWDHPKKIPFVQKHKEGAICKNGVFSLRIAHIAPSLCFCTKGIFFGWSQRIECIWDLCACS